MPQNLWPWNNPNGLREAGQTNFAYNKDTSIAAHVLTAANLTGGAVGVTLAMTGALTAGETATTDTAASIIAAIPQAQRYVGFTYSLTVLNESSGNFAWTLAAGAGVTITGTETVADNTWREFLVTIASATTVTMQSVGTGTNS